MVTRRNRILTEAVGRLSSMNQVLGGDSLLGLAVLKDVAEARAAGDSRPWRLSFGIKTAVRSFFGHVDGLAYAMRRATVDLAPQIGVILTEAEELKLREKRRKSNGAIVPRRLAPDESLKLACRFFPSLFGASFALDTNARQWSWFLDLQVVRNGFTHPKEFDDITAINGLSRIQPCAVWFAHEMMRMLLACEKRLFDAARRRNLPDVPEMAPLPIQEPIFGSEHHQQVRNSLGSSIGYLREVVFALKRETDWALELVTQRRDLAAPDGQFALRTFVRTLDSDVQGTTAFLRSFLAGASEREEILLSAEERARLEGELPHGEALAVASNIWSSKFGYGREVATRGREWISFNKMLALRDKLVHPKRPMDLRIDPQVLGTLLEALTWYGRSLEVLEFDLERLPS